MKFRNPIIPGFYPDPSICRVREDFYLVNSTFQFFPGIPIFHSRDLISWEQIGHVLTRESQVQLVGCSSSGGIYAPTIRYHDSRFYMITTNVNGNVSGRRDPTINFIVHTDDIHREWSDPVFVDHGGIDPSLFWDDDGRCYYVGTHILPDGTQCIAQFEINPDTGEKLSETRGIWKGSGGRCPEGPHMYKINGVYYLMVAEGGTEWGHMETIARSGSVWGPFESCPHNPIVTNRDMQVNALEALQPGFQELGCIGHADLVDDPNGNWWLVMLGVRPSQAKLHHIGRETMLAPVTWEAGWPVVNGGKPITSVMEGPETPAVHLDQNGFALRKEIAFSEDFTVEDALPYRWEYMRNPIEKNYQLQNGLTLFSGEGTLNDLGTPTFVGVRQQSLSGTAETVLEFNPEKDTEEAGMTVFHTEKHHYDLIITRRDGKRAAILYRRTADMEAWSAPVKLPEDGPVILQIRFDKLHYEFFANGLKVGEGSSQLLSTEIMVHTFTGCFFGLFRQGNGAEIARYSSFSVKVTPSESVE